MTYPRSQTTGRRFTAFLLALMTWGAAATAHAQIALAPDSNRYLIQREVPPNEQWAISYNFEDGTMTGNVFKTDGGEPSFIWCEFTDIVYAENPADNVYVLDCWGADRCTDAPCDDSQWSLIATDISLPASFVLPNGTRSTFGGQVEPIFAAKCAIDACHDSNAMAAGLDLSAEVAYANIVRVPSNQQPDQNLVTPFDVGESYLSAKITGTGEGGMMPLHGMLSRGEIEAIKRWILEGASDN